MNTSLSKVMKRNNLQELKVFIKKFLKVQFICVLCSCCTQTWFKEGVLNANCLKTSLFAKKCLTGFKSVDEIEWVCYTCYNNLKSYKVPASAVANGMVLLPTTTTTKTVTTLPRTLNDSETLQVQLKKNQIFKQCVLQEAVRQNKCIKALQWLLLNNVLFQSQGITINQECNIETKQHHSLGFNRENNERDKNYNQLYMEHEQASLYRNKESDGGETFKVTQALMNG